MQDTTGNGNIRHHIYICYFPFKLGGADEGFVLRYIVNEISKLSASIFRYQRNSGELEKHKDHFSLK